MHDGVVMKAFGEQKVRSGQLRGTHLPPLWLEFQSWKRHHNPTVFFLEYAGFPLSSKTNIS